MKKILFALIIALMSNICFAGAPQSGVDFEITNSTTGKVTKTKTDALGNFSVCDLPTGSYTVTCTLDGKKITVPSNEASGKHEIQSPRDAASGLATGKRMHKPYTITKELDRCTLNLTCADGCCKGSLNTTRSNIK